MQILATDNIGLFFEILILGAVIDELIHYVLWYMGTRARNKARASGQFSWGYVAIFLFLLSAVIFFATQDLINFFGFDVLSLFFFNMFLLVLTGFIVYKKVLNK